MKTFKIIGIIILVMIVTFFIGAFFLPSTVHTEKKIVVNAEMNKVYNLVNDFHEWHNWSPWYDTLKEYSISGKPSGVGAVIRWVDSKDQVGERTITVSEMDKHIEVMTTFREENSEAKMDFFFTGLPDNKVAVKLTFKMDNQFSYPFGRYIAWMLQAGVDYSFPIALQNIKEYAEQKDTGYQVVEEEFAAGDYLLIKDSCALDVMDSVMGANFGQIMGYIQMSDVKPMGAPIVFWQKFEPQAISVFWAAIPVDKPSHVRGRVENFRYEGGKICKIEYYGPYEGSAGAWNSLDSYIESKGYTMSGAPFEQYITDPTTEPDTTKWQTNICFPVKE